MSEHEESRRDGRSGPAQTPVSAHAPMSFREFVLMVAGLMALNALAIDVMLPALPDIGAALDVLRDNDRQMVLSTYLIGFGLGQIVIGSVSDRFGRRAVLIGGLACYVITALICAAAPTFATLLVARFVQGLASAAPRVITTAIVRDCYEGRRMASVMSLAMTIFMVVPVVAPAIGQVIILVAPWQAIFLLLAFYGSLMALWVMKRLPETLPASRREVVSLGRIASAYATVFRSRQTMGYALAAGMMFGAIFGFLMSAQQIFTEIFGLGVYFPLAFAAIALAMSLSSFINARLVGRLGTRLLSHGAVAVFTLLAGILALTAHLDILGFVPFMILLAGMQFLIGMIFGNFAALALETQGKFAGTASSLFGSTTTILAALIGYGVGQAYDGTLVPLANGYVAFGLASLAIIAVTEKGRLFR
jgi:DHA1 family bicyclomycin/chloramphenicol resistance-like MFS transporter